MQTNTVEHRENGQVSSVLTSLMDILFEAQEAETISVTLQGLYHLAQHILFAKLSTMLISQLNFLTHYRINISSIYSIWRTKTYKK